MSGKLIKSNIFQTQSPSSVSSLEDGFCQVFPINDRLPSLCGSGLIKASQEPNFALCFLILREDLIMSIHHCKLVLHVIDVLRKKIRRADMGLHRSRETNWLVPKPGFPNSTLPKSCIREVSSTPEMYLCHNPSPFCYCCKCFFFQTKIPIIPDDHICSPNQFCFLGIIRLPAEYQFFDLIITSALKFMAHLIDFKNYQEVKTMLQR